MMKKNMTLLVTVAFFCMVIFMMTSCATKSSTVQEDKSPVTTTEEEKPAVEEEKPAEVEVKEETVVSERPAEPQEQTKAAQAYAEQQIEEFQSPIYFDFDKSDLKPESQESLRNKAFFLKQNSSFSVRIEGHTDERGTNEYNLALGERRADAAANYLKSLGISDSRISTLSYGEEKPVAYGSNETAWSRNRRDEFVLIK